MIANIVLKVIDAKATHELKLSHRVQVAVYALMLSNLINERVHRKDGVPISVSSKGGVWLRDDPTFQEIDLEPVVRFLTRFFSDSGRFGSLINQSTSGALRSTPWHLDRTCQTCSFVDYCKHSATRDGKTDISYIYKIGKQEKTLAANFVKKQTQSAHHVTDLEEIHHVLSLHADSYAEKAKELRLPEEKVEDDLAKQMAALSVAAPSPSSSTVPEVSIDDITAKIASVSISSTSAEAPPRPESPPRPSALQAFKQSNMLNSPSDSANRTPPGTPTGSGTVSSMMDVSPTAVSTDLPSSPFVPAISKKSKARTPKKAALSRELWIVAKRLEAYRTNKAVSLCRASHELVQSEDCSVHISIFHDKPNARVFAWSILVRPRKKTILDRLKKLSKEDWSSLNSNDNQSHHSLVVDDNGMHISQLLADPRKADTSAVSFLEQGLVDTLHRCLEYAAEVRKFWYCLLEFLELLTFLLF
jgi:hypothetical protein